LYTGSSATAYVDKFRKNLYSKAACIACLISTLKHNTTRHNKQTKAVTMKKAPAYGAYE
jgi:hypothetical protein